MINFHRRFRQVNRLKLAGLPLVLTDPLKWIRFFRPRTAHRQAARHEMAAKASHQSLSTSSQRRHETAANASTNHGGLLCTIDRHNPSCSGGKATQYLVYLFG